MILAISFFSCSPSADAQKKEANTKSQTESGNKYLEKTWMVTLEGDTLRLKDFSGKVVIIDFWATWCGPCRASIPLYVKLYEKYADKGLVVIGVDVNEGPDEIAPFASEAGINYQLAFFNEDLNSIYAVQGIPTVFIFDKKGNLLENFVGYSSEMDLKIESIIEEELIK